MNRQVTLCGKSLGIELSASAEAAILRRQRPLVAEMELYFSCLVRKKVRFHDAGQDTDSEAVPVNEQLSVRFRPVMTQSCSVEDARGDEPPITDFPISNPTAFVPRWLRIDYQGGQWSGEFGY